MSIQLSELRDMFHRVVVTVLEHSYNLFHNLHSVVQCKKKASLICLKYDNVCKRKSKMVLFWKVLESLRSLRSLHAHARVRTFV